MVSIVLEQLLRTGEVVEVVENSYLLFACPVCGHDIEKVEPYAWTQFVTEEGRAVNPPFCAPSFRRCVGCGTVFGISDFPRTNGSVTERWRELRFQWLDRGGWSPDQLTRLQAKLAISSESLREQRELQDRGEPAPPFDSTVDRARAQALTTRIGSDVLVVFERFQLRGWQGCFLDRRTREWVVLYLDAIDEGRIKVCQVIPDEIDLEEFLSIAGCLEPHAPSYDTNDRKVMVREMILRNGDAIELRRESGSLWCPVCGGTRQDHIYEWNWGIHDGRVSGFPWATGCDSICGECMTQYGFDDDSSDGSSIALKWERLRQGWLDRVGWTKSALDQIERNLGITVKSK